MSSWISVIPIEVNSATILPYPGVDCPGPPSFRAVLSLRHGGPVLEVIKDHLSADEIVRGLREQYGEEPSTRTIQRDIETLRDQGAPIEYDRHRHGFYYAQQSWQLPEQVTVASEDLGADVSVISEAVTSTEESENAPP